MWSLPWREALAKRSPDHGTHGIDHQLPSPYEAEGGRRPDEGEGLARRLVHEQDKHGVHSQTGLR